MSDDDAPPSATPSPLPPVDLDAITSLDDFNFDMMFGSAVSLMTKDELGFSLRFKRRFTLAECKEMYQVKLDYVKSGDDEILLSIFRRYIGSERAVRLYAVSDSGTPLSHDEMMENCMDEAEYFLRQALLGFYRVGDMVLGDPVTSAEKDAVDVIKRHFFNLKDALDLLDLKEGFNGKIDDSILYRYLRAYNNDPDVAEYNWRKCMAWRRDRQPNAITRTQVYPSLQTGKCFYFGRSKGNHLTLYIFPKCHFPDETPLADSVDFGLWLIEYGTRLLRDDDSYADRVNIIYDRDEFGYANLDMWLIKEMSLLVRYYPEALNALYILRANWLYNSIFKLCKSFLPAGIQERVKMVYDIAEMKEVYDEGNLLKQHGGTAEVRFDPEVHLPEPTPEEVKPWLRIRRERQKKENEEKKEE